MPRPSATEPPSIPAPTCDPSDEFLVAGLLGGDEAALVKLMDRHDRLVRYTVFRMSRSRCVQDPAWLSTIASDTWTGLVRSLHRNPKNLPKSLKSYLVRIARNKCISALRGAPPRHASLAGDDETCSIEIEASTDSPLDLISRMEELETLRACVAELEPDDRRLADELEAITERRWKDAAATLGMQESTLRSRWKRVLDRLRRCVAGKTGEVLAPETESSDPFIGRP